jgi:hypothetical protein
VELEMAIEFGGKVGVAALFAKEFGDSDGESPQDSHWLLQKEASHFLYGDAIGNNFDVR